MKNAPKYRDYIYVGIQLVLFVVYVLPVTIGAIHMPSWGKYMGIILLGFGVLLGGVALLQLNTKLSPFPTPVNDGKLLTSGAFRVSRHPIYTAILGATLGYALYADSAFKMLIFILLLVLFYFKSSYEEQLLTAKYPEYPEYKTKVGRFFLKISV